MEFQASDILVFDTSDPDEDDGYPWAMIIRRVHDDGCLSFIYGNDHWDPDAAPDRNNLRFRIRTWPVFPS
jgi:hypothetical protein